MKLSVVKWCLVCSIVGAPALALSQDRDKPHGQQPPPAKPAQEPRPQPPKQDPPKQEPPKKEQPKPAPQGERDHSRLDAATAELQKRSAEGKLAPDDIARLRQAIDEDIGDAGGNPRVARMRERLNSQLGDLEQRAKNAQLQKSDVIAFRERIVDSRLQHALENLDERAKAKGIERQDFERIKALLDQRAELVKAEGNAEEMAFEQTLRDKLGTSIDGLEQRGFDTIEPKDITSIREALADRRLDRELSSLERNSMSKRATDGDIQALRDAIADRGELAGVAAPDAGSVQARYLAVLEGMKEKVKSGQITREEFATLRAQLTQKAREASGDKK
jgi:hypothetical protein